jgi:hypothetical protein
MCSGCQKRSLNCDYEAVNEGIQPAESATSGMDDQLLDRIQQHRSDQPVTSWSQNSTSPGLFSATIQDHMSPGSTDIPLNIRQNGFAGENRPIEGLASERVSYSSFEAPFSTSQTILTNTSTTPGRHSQVLETASSEFWQQSSLLAMNWSFDDYVPAFESEAYETNSPTQQPKFLTVLGSQQVLEQSGLSMDASPNSSNSYADSLNMRSHTGGAAPEYSSPRTHRDGSSTMSLDSGVAAGHFYVDGDGARLPRIKNLLQDKPKMTADSLFAFDQISQSQGHDGTFVFHESIVKPLENHEANINYNIEWQLSLQIYQNIAESFSQTCVLSSYFKPFQTSFLLPHATLNTFLQQYFAHFQPALPFIHVPSFESKNVHWLLVLAMTAIGSHFTDVEEHGPSPAMHEFLRRAICVAVRLHCELLLYKPANHRLQAEDRAFQRENKILMAQAKLLNSIGLMYTGDASDIARCWQPDLRTFYEDEWPALLEHRSQSNSEENSQEDVNWELWCDTEGLRRLGYCVSVGL